MLRFRALAALANPRLAWAATGAFYMRTIYETIDLLGVGLICPGTGVVSPATLASHLGRGRAPAALSHLPILSVSIGPGCTVFTVMPLAPRSRAQPRV